jgi:hypothetical protein
MNPLRIAACALACLAALSPTALAQDEGEPAKKEKLAVIQIGEELSIVDADEVPATQKRLAQEYKTALEAWNEAKKQAAKNKTKFADPKPQARKLKVIANNLRSREEAQEKLDKLEGARKKKEEVKSDKADDGA